MRPRNLRQAEQVRDEEGQATEEKTPRVNTQGADELSVQDIVSRSKRRDRFTPRRVRIKGKTYWQVALGSELKDGRRLRHRRTFADRVEAEGFARLKRVERENRGIRGVSLSERLRGEAIESEQILSPYGVSILEAAKEYARRRELATRSETVSGALSLFLSTKQSDGMSIRYLEDLRSRLGRFSETFGSRKLADIMPAEIDEWLRDLGQAPLSRNTYHLRLNAFFEYTRQRGWVETNPLRDVPRAKVIQGPPGILTVEQAARLLESADTETLPYHAIGLFAGLRSAELSRLEWREVLFDERLIEVTASKSKTAARRLVTIQPNLALWLEPYRGQHGKICPSQPRNLLTRDRRQAGILDWPSNALRHSFASYHLGYFKNAAALALEMGHVSSTMLFRHYRELVRPAEAERFWRLVPIINGESQLTVVA